MSYDYITRQHHGRETDSHNYHTHVSTVETMPSMVTDAPPYPGVHMIFNHNVGYEDEGHESRRKHHAPAAHKKVHIVEYEQTTEYDRNGNCKVVEESIDMEADGFIKQKHKNFERNKIKNPLRESRVHANFPVSVRRFNSYPTSPSISQTI
ncbi:hypothetical protein F0562_024318 [Nyssa sinensis]|uniref:Uncharacterized protein n=1 Tax=Nyssa sinensis TaxID=561372 RepID=A0A5J5BCG8_9ASTE|nr:hypothetical protein F0562_024318 [Nyssa sinensis]